MELVSNVYTQKFDHLEGHVGDVNQLVVGEGQHVEEAELCEGSRLDLLHTVMIQEQLLQGGEAIERLLQQSGQEKERGRESDGKEITSHLFTVALCLLLPGKGCQFCCRPSLRRPLDPESGKRPPSP